MYFRLHWEERNPLGFWIWVSSRGERGGHHITVVYLLSTEEHVFDSNENLHSLKLNYTWKGKRINNIPHMLKVLLVKLLERSGHFPRDISKYNLISWPPSPRYAGNTNLRWRTCWKNLIETWAEQIPLQQREAENSSTTEPYFEGTPSIMETY